MFVVLLSRLLTQKHFLVTLFNTDRMPPLDESVHEPFISDLHLLPVAWHRLFAM